MLVIGKIIRKMDLVFSISKMGINIKEVGLIIKDMVKELFGFVIPKINLGGSILEIGKMIRKKEEVPCSTKLAIGMMECGWIVNPMEKGE